MIQPEEEGLGRRGLQPVLVIWEEVAAISVLDIHHFQPMPTKLAELFSSLC